MLILEKSRKAVRYQILKLAKFLDKITKGRLTPNQVTWIGVAAHIPAALLLAYGRLELAAILLIIFGLFDVLDGELARLQKVASPRGMVLDASTDRVKEVMIYSAIAYYLSQTAYYSWAWLPMLALGTTLTVTYVKAKGEVAYAISNKNVDHHHINRHFNEGLVPFETRILIIILGLIADQILIATAIVAVLGTVSVFERINHITRKI